ncbi:hypothetical protein [Methylorubrum populi]|uniref:Uncharacterized protein n=1 Tax=Methylorubrum populi TaxID=223967 RepID=A0A833MUN9_9HYPH|nr:hypothetical protein [Methylorubrum populi]KAB7782412.1 hypothetical protein F8B43_5167 [Methylorubrum populi]
MPDRTPDQQQLADLFLSLGVRLPIRVCGMHGRGLAEADGRPRFAGLPGDGPSNERAIALAFAAAVNIATGTPDHESGPLPVLRPMTPGTIRDAENPFDPEHLIAVARAARLNPRADAAE